MAVLDELKKYNFNFSKKFGQNFIFDTNLLVSIVSSANLPDNAQVLEIGTGAGTLTKIIADKASKVISFEIDPNLREYLTDKFAGTPNVELVFQDVMNVATDKIDDMFDGQYHMIANLPYYITTPIIFKFLEESKKLKTLTIMVQQEVADRLIAKENTADNAPQKYRNPTKNRGHDRTVNRTCTSNRRKMVSHQNGRLCLNIVNAVRHKIRRS